jgi:hypothetical protein
LAAVGTYPPPPSFITPEETPLLITITRLLARNVSTLFRRSLALSPREARFLPITVIVGHGVLVFRAATSEFAVEYQEAADQPEAQLNIPWELLHVVAGNKTDEVTIVLEGSRLVARWQDKDIPQMKCWELPDPEAVKPFPESPEAWTENSPELLTAIHHAFETTDSESARYALACVQLRGGSGSLAATDGRQMLMQHGFAFGFDDDVLVRPTSVFGASQLDISSPVMLGRVEKHIAVRTGPWTFWLPIDTDGRFPRVDDIVPRIASTDTTVELHPSDARFLAENLSRLPKTEFDSNAVTLDLNGSVLIRSRGDASTQPTELQLTNSSKTGNDVRLVTDRTYLSRALAMGLTRLHIADPASPILAQDERRSYVWAVLEKDGVVKPSADAIVVESPPAFATTKPRTESITRSKSVPRQPVAVTPPQTMENISTVEQPAENASPIDQAIHLRGVLRDALTATSDLVRSLKRQQKQQRAYKSAIASLRELQGVA